MAQRPTDPLVRDFLASRRLTWSDHHRAVATSSLNRWCAWLTGRATALVDAVMDDCADYLDERRKAVGTATLIKDYQFLKWLYAWLHDEGELAGRDPMARVKGPGEPAHDPRRTPHITPDVYDRLQASWDRRRVVECRNAAICSLMYRCGARGIEVCRADRDRLDLDNATLEVIGKSGQWETIALAFETCRLIERYLRRRDQGGGDRLAPLFVGTAATRAGNGRLAPGAIAEALQRRGDRLGGVHLPLHAFRRAFAISAKANGLNDTTVQHLGRWRDPRMVARYQRNAQAELSRAEFHANDPTARATTTRRRPLKAV